MTHLPSYFDECQKNGISYFFFVWKHEYVVVLFELIDITLYAFMPCGASLIEETSLPSLIIRHNDRHMVLCILANQPLGLLPMTTFQQHGSSLSLGQVWKQILSLGGQISSTFHALFRMEIIYFSESHL